MSDRNIQRLLNVVDHNLNNINGTMSYERLTTAIIHLGNLIMESETTEETWWMGESNYVSLDELIIGAAWHYTEWHGGQSSQGYKALSILGQIFTPGYADSPDHDNQAYIQLAEMAGGE